MVVEQLVARFVQELLRVLASLLANEHISLSSAQGYVWDFARILWAYLVLKWAYLYQIAPGYVQEFYKIPEVCMSVWSIFDAILALARLESYARPIIYQYLLGVQG